MRTALTVAGSDSGGGAGIQADLKSFAAVGVHGTSVITCVTAQNTREVASILALPTAEIVAQLRAVLDDFDVRGAKTGMLYSAEIVEAVAPILGPTDFPLVVDPVMVATVGARLEKDDFRDALVDRLLPRADLVTPNRHEAERLAGFPVEGLEDMERAARAIRMLGPRAVLVKGGHVAGELVDVLDDGRTVRRLRAFRHPQELHGSGCTLAASIAGYLALGEPLAAAVQAGRRRVAQGFLESYRAGHGVGIINSHAAPDRYDVWRSVQDALEGLSTALPRPAARRGARVAFALPGATRAQDVCAGLPGGRPAGFGSDRGAAAVLLEVLCHDPRARAAIGLNAGTGNARGLQRSGLSAVRLSAQSAAGVRRALAERGATPDVLVDARAKDGETGMWVLGRNPQDALRKLRRLRGA